jgi:ParB/RepB/Spo0J family partition protein
VKKFRDEAAAPLQAMVAGAAAAAVATRSVGGESAVLPEAVASSLEQKIAARGYTLQKLPPALIKLDENVRRSYDDETIAILAESLKKDGLIQFPTLHLKERGGCKELVCVNGHRRVLAARRLGWELIECRVMAFDSTKEQLYHAINANMSEDVFYLDLAQAYANAVKFGEADQDIADRVGVNVRTVRQFLRLATMSQACAQLAREYAKLFSPTWAIKLARKGELPPEGVLYPQMQEMVAAGRAWMPLAALENVVETGAQEQEQEAARGRLHEFLSGSESDRRVKWARNLVELLRDAGLLKSNVANAVEKSFEAMQSAM